MNPRVAAEHRAKIKKHYAQLRVAMVIVLACATLVAMGFVHDWSWFVRIPLALLGVMVVFDMFAVLSKLRVQYKKLAKATGAGS